MRSEDIDELITKEKEKLMRNFQYGAQLNTSATELILNTLASLSAQSKIIEARMNQLEQTWQKALDS